MSTISEVAALIEKGTIEKLNLAVHRYDVVKVRLFTSQLQNPGRTTWDYGTFPLKAWLYVNRNKHMTGGPEIREVLNALLEGGINVNASEQGLDIEEKITALHIAAKHNNSYCAKLLLEKGAVASIRCDGPFGLSGTARDWASKLGKSPVVQVIDEAEIQFADKNGNTEIKKEIESLKLKLQKANKIKEDMKHSKDYLDEKTYEQLNCQLEIMEKEEKYQKAKALKDELAKLDEAYLRLITAESYKDPNDIDEMKKTIILKKIETKKIEDDIQKIKGAIETSVATQIQIEAILGERKRKEESENFVNAENLNVLAGTIASKKRRLTALETDDSKRVTVEKSNMECIICFDMPQEEVWSCSGCDNIICNTCLPRLSAQCPTCRVDLVEKPVRRNRAVERILQTMK